MEIFNALSYLSIAGKIKILSKAVAYYKEKEGRGAMSEAVRQYAMEYAKEYGEEQKEEGILQGKNNMLYSLVSNGKLKIDVAAEEANVSLGKFEKSMEEAGYKIPEFV